MKYEFEWVEVPKDEASQKLTVDIPEGAQIVQVADEGWHILVAIPVTVPPESKDASRVVAPNVFSSEANARYTVAHLRTLIDRHNFASIADYYTYVGYKRGYQDSQWGWTNLDDVSWETVEDGWVIAFPPVHKLEDDVATSTMSVGEDQQEMVIEATTILDLQRDRDYAGGVRLAQLVLEYFRKN